jgi:hypothetical protein
MHPTLATAEGLSSEGLPRAPLGQPSSPHWSRPRRKPSWRAHPVSQRRELRVIREGVLGDVLL